MRSLLVLLLSLTLIGCSAREDFESDLTATGVIFGLSEMGACAEVFYNGTGYDAEVFPAPASRCSRDGMGGNSYSEYLAYARTEIAIMAGKADQFRSAFCSDRVDVLRSLPAEPGLTSAVSAGLVIDNAYYSSYRWISVVDGAYELTATMQETWGLLPGQRETARMARYDEYVSFMAGWYVAILASTAGDMDCYSEQLARFSALFPGWAFLVDSDPDASKPTVVFNGLCHYPATNPLCTTLGPQF